MKFLFSILLLVLLTLPVQAFEGLEESASLGIFNRINCDTGLTCSKAAGGIFEIDVSELAGVTQNRVSVGSNTTLTSSQCGSTVIVGGAHTVTLPEASTVLGCRYTVIVGSDTDTTTIDPDDADQLLLVTNAAGDSLTADAVGESITLEAISASEWAPIGAEKGTWTDAD
jgi:hypothetical protein